jgi:hypothetical protein
MHQSWTCSAIAVAAGVLMAGAVAVSANPPATGQAGVDAPVDEAPAATWTQIDATDRLGRTLTPAEQVGPLRTDRIVAMFYWTWHIGSNRGKNTSRPGPYDISKIVAAHPEAVRHKKHPAWGPNWHHWGEPLFGYYHGTDRWVIRRHLQMLALAGIDVLMCDTTNYFGIDPEMRTYRSSAVTIMETIRDLIRDGQPTPRFGFYTITGGEHKSHLMMDEILDLYYKEDAPYRYPEAWFRLDGRPLMVGDLDRASARAKACFTIRRDCYSGPKAGGWHGSATRGRRSSRTTSRAALPRPWLRARTSIRKRTASRATAARPGTAGPCAGATSAAPTA